MTGSTGITGETGSTGITGTTGPTGFTDMKVLNKDKIMQLLFAAFQESQIKIADLERRLNAIGA